MKRFDIINIKRCKKCNSNEFIIVEKIYHLAELSEVDMDLTAFRVIGHKIIKIVCKKCKSNYKEDDFKLINFY